MTIHVVGAGLAGLAAAVALADAGRRVVVHEAAPRAGGRCRSWFDAALGLEIDNGNHLLLSGNDAALGYLRTVGATDRMRGPSVAHFPFADVSTGARWTIRPNAGRVPWWVTRPDRRAPGAGLGAHLAMARLLVARRDATVGETIATTGPLWDRFVRPLLVSALNTPPEGASARLAAAVLRGSLARGGQACRPLVATPTLAAAFVDPALAWLRARGAEVRTGRRLRAIDGRTLRFADGDETSDAVVLALPAWEAAALVPGLSTPTEHCAIVNAHFALPPAADAAPLVGLVGGTAEWAFALPGRYSATVSAADRLDAMSTPALAAAIWSDVARAYRLDAPLPPHRIVRERRATFAATPAQDARRPGAVTPVPGLFLAGDWTDTGLPATLEGAARSGARAAALALAFTKP